MNGTKKQRLPAARCKKKKQSCRSGKLLQSEPSIQSRASFLQFWDPSLAPRVSSTQLRCGADGLERARHGERVRAVELALERPHRSSLILGCLSGRIMTRREAGGVTFGLPACLLYFPTVFLRICSKFKFREKMQKFLEIH